MSKGIRLEAGEEPEGFFDQDEENGEGHKKVEGPRSLPFSSSEF
jgi:hypothetical protein